MHELTTILRGGHVIDGTGTPAFAADIALAGGRIAAIGEVPGGTGAKEIDCQGLSICPGFIEAHTHYDPQLCWDSLATPAAEHGVTTVVAGGCSLSLAPLVPEMRQKLTDIYYKVEDLRNEFFDVAVPYSWETFGEFLDHIRPGLGVNVAPVLGHSALRLYVMGKDAQKRPATLAERERMGDILAEALNAGAIGLSSCYEHLRDENDDPMPAALADFDERLHLARVCADAGRPWVQYSVEPVKVERRMDEIRECARIARESGASLSINGTYVPAHGGTWRQDLELMEAMAEAGGRIAMQMLARPLDQWFSFAKVWNPFYQRSGWARIMLQPIPERLDLFAAALQDRSLLDSLGEELRINALDKRLALFSVERVSSARNRRFVGRSLGEISEAEGRDLAEIMIEIAVHDGLDTSFELNNTENVDEDIVPMLLMHPAMQVGGSDAGAHIYQFAGEGDSTFMLAHWVRDTKKIRLEDAIRRMTSDLARDLGLPERGRIAQGCFADLVVFDPETVGQGSQEAVSDVPGGGFRFIRRSTGIAKTIVNGEILFEAGTYTDQRPGIIV